MPGGRVGGASGAGNTTVEAGFTGFTTAFASARSSDESAAIDRANRASKDNATQASHRVDFFLIVACFSRLKAAPVDEWLPAFVGLRKNQDRVSSPTLVNTLICQKTRVF
jgi:hypothetical protein